MEQKKMSLSELTDIEEITTSLISVKRDVSNGLMMDEMVIDKVKNILGKNFEGVSVFFKNIFFSFKQPKLTVSVTRRCFLVAEWFLYYHLLKSSDVKKEFELVTSGNYFCIRNKDSGIENFILSDKGLPILIFDNKLRSKIELCTVVDDILIHGRQLAKIKEKLTHIFKSFNCDVKIEKTVYMESRESAFLPADSKYKNSICAEWLILSRRIVKMINYLNLPYVSYINSYTNNHFDYHESDEMIKCLDANENLEVLQFGEDERECFGKMSYFIIEKTTTYASFENLKCIRYYYNYKTQTAMFIPYVIFSKINERFDNINVIKNLFGEYLVENALNSLVKEISNYIYALTKISKNYYNNIIGQFEEYVYYLLSCIASNFYAHNFFDAYLPNCHIAANWYNDIINCLNKAFGTKIVNIIINKESYRKSQNGEKKEIKLDKDKYKKDGYDKINTYCGNRWFECEKAAVKREDKPLKNSLEDVLENNLEEMQKQSLLYKYFYLYKIIDFCDNGRLAISCDIRKDGGKECVVEAGELGALSARTSNDIDLKNKLRLLLGMKYYRYLLV